MKAALKYIVTSIFSFLISCCNIYATVNDLVHIPQTGKEAVSLPSCDVNALCRHIDFDYSYSTGKATIVCPLYTINCGSLTLPVTISYQTGGVKVDEESGQIGLSWTLNYGGFISRNIVGRPDVPSGSNQPSTKQVISYVRGEDRHTQIPSVPTIDSDPILYMKKVALQEVDAEYDRYYWQAGNESGTFIISGDSIIKLTQSDAEIEKTDTGFKITTVDGTVYSYEQGEKISRSCHATIVSSISHGIDYNDVTCGWRLVSIVSPNECDTIYFAYSPASNKKRYISGRTTYFSAHTTSLSSPSGLGSFQNFGSVQIQSSPNCNPWTTFEYSNRKVLGEITWRGGRIQTYPRQNDGLIDSIHVVSNLGTIVRSICFRYDTQLREGVRDRERELMEVPIMSEYTILSDNQVIDGSQFEYCDVSGISKDLFGYNNYLGAGAPQPHNLPPYNNLIPGGAWIWGNGNPGYGWIDPNGDEPSSLMPPCESVVMITPDSLMINPNRRPRVYMNDLIYTGAAQGSLTRITSVSGTETTLSYEPAWFPSSSFGGWSSIGTRIAGEIVLDKNTWNRRVRAFSYSDPVTTIPLDSFNFDWFVSQTGYKYQENTMGGQLGSSDAYTTTVTLLANSKVPGLSPEDAAVYYGKVTETIRGDGIEGSINTTYEYDLSKVRAQFVSGISHTSLDSNSDAKYCGTMINLLDNYTEYSYGLLSLLAPKYNIGYYQEYNTETAPLKKITVWSGDSIDVEPLQTTEYRYSYIENEPISIGYFCEPLTRIIQNTIGIYNPNLECANDINRFELKIKSAKFYVDSVIVCTYDQDGRSQRVITEYQYNNHMKPFQPNPQGLGYIIQMAPNSLLYKIRTICGTQEFTKTFTYASSAYPENGYPILQEMQKRRSLLTKETTSFGSCVMTNRYVYSVFQNTPGAHLSDNIILHNGCEVDSTSITSYDGYGNPTTVVRNGDTPVQYSWSANGLYLDSVSINGDITTRYEHIPLIGYSKIVSPAGTERNFDYKGERLISMDVADVHVADYEYSLFGFGEEGENSIKTNYYSQNGNESSFSSVLVLDAFGHETVSYKTKGTLGYGSAVCFDALGRQVAQYLQSPQTYGTDLMTATASTIEYYQDSLAQNRVNYDKLDRPINGFLSGSDFQDHPNITEYLLNTSSIYSPLALRKFTFTSNMLRSTQNYSSGTVNIIRKTDGDGKISSSFIDFRGRVLLNRMVNGDTYADTYYVYDDSDNLVMVLPPMCVSNLTGNMIMMSPTNETIQKYAYIYTYDESLKLRQKKLPGLAAVRYWYDNTGYPILVQDGNQSARGVVGFSIPDIYGREVLSGECRITNALTNLVESGKIRAVFNNQNLSVSIMGYEINLPMEDIQVNLASYYDNYNYLQLPLFDSLRQKVLQNPTPVSRQNNCNLLTGKIRRVLKPVDDDDVINTLSDFLFDAYYYDLRERLYRTVSLDHKGGLNIVNSIYSNTDKLLEISHNRIKDNETENINYTYTYDMFDRTSNIGMTRGGNTMRLALMSYDGAGNLSSVRYGTSQPVQYSYSSLGSLSSISGQNFVQNLHYADSPTPSYSGNISSIEWSGNDQISRRYDFSYDGFNRLISANYSEATRTPEALARLSITNCDVSPVDYSTIYSYDLNSNLLSVSRKGMTDISVPVSLSNPRQAFAEFGLIDRLNMSYDGNMLKRVRDTAADIVYVNASDFNDGVNRSVEYTYDQNGNMTSDLNRGIESIEYNPYNLPCRITYDNGLMTDFYYSADGTLLRRLNHGVSLSSTLPMLIDSWEDHYGIFIYNGNNRVNSYRLTKIESPTGYIEGNLPKHYIKDYQGNVRQVISNDGSVEQDSHYYPFGMLMGESSHILKANGVSGYTVDSANNRFFCGKEWISDNGINLYDFEARYQDPSTGRLWIKDTNPFSCEEVYKFEPMVDGGLLPCKSECVTNESSN